MPGKLKPAAIFLLAAIAFMFSVQEAVSAEKPVRKKKGPELLTVVVSSRQDLTRVYFNLSARAAYEIGPAEDGTLKLNLLGAALSPGLAVPIKVNDGRIDSIEVTRLKGSVAVSIGKGSDLVHEVSLEENGTHILQVTVRERPRPAEKFKEVAKDGPPGPRLPRLGGDLKNETASRLSGHGLSKVRNIAQFEASGSLSTNISYKASARAYYDAVFDLTDNYPELVRQDQESEAVLRDFYMDFSLGDWDLRAGRQGIVWGEAIGLFFADIVNAKDLREFVLPEFEYIRKPQWAADLEYTRGNFHLELVWIPVPEFHDFGLPGSEFPQAFPIPQGTAALFNGVDEPSAGLSNSETGARVSYLADGWDLSVFHFYTWDKFPTNFRTVAAPGLYVFSPEHKRINITGATFAKEYGGAVLKGELVYYHGKRFSVLDETDLDGVVEKDYLDYLLGVDYTFFDRYDFNFQFMQRVIFAFDDNIFREERVRSSASVWFKTGFLDDRLEPELTIISSIEELDMLLRAKLNYKFAESWQARIGLDIFDGPLEGLFGQYRDRDRVYAEVRYDF